MILHYRLVWLLFVLPFAGSCQNKTGSGYDFSKARVVQLDKELEEISGIEMVGGRMFAIADNKGSLYEIDLQSGKTTNSWKFGKSSDYEGLAFLNGRFYVLDSNGDVLEVDTASGSAKTHTFPFRDDNEFEIFYYDEAAGKMVLVCKECSTDKKASVSFFHFDPATGTYTKPDSRLDAKAIASLRGKKMERIKASGGAVHPLTGDVYIVSSINKMLLVTDRNGNAKEVYELQRKQFEQPEGVAFDEKGNIYISNEKGEGQRANIIVAEFNQLTGN